MSNIFISYAHADAFRVEDIKHELRRLGIVHDGDRFIDPNHVAVPGSSLRGVLRKEIEAASMVVVLWGREASASANVNYEAGMADALDKPIVLVVPEGEASRPRLGASDMRVVEFHGQAARDGRPATATAQGCD